MHLVKYWYKLFCRDGEEKKFISVNYYQNLQLFLFQNLEQLLQYTKLKQDNVRNIHDTKLSKWFREVAV